MFFRLLIVCLLLLSWANSFTFSSTLFRNRICIARTKISLFFLEHEDDTNDNEGGYDIDDVPAPRHYTQEGIFKSAASTLFVMPILLFSLNAPPITSNNNSNNLFAQKIQSIISHPPAAYALQAKNEALCNTGFFTNVGAWYCTDIGNIGDEGRPKPLSAESESSVTSLLSKLDVSGEPIGVVDTREGKKVIQQNKLERDVFGKQKDDQNKR